MISWKNFSLSSFFIGAGIGFLVGVLLLGVFVNYLITSAVSGTGGEGVFLASQIEQVRQGILIEQQQKTATSVYGRVVSIGGGTLVLEVRRSASAPQNLTFVYDDSTTIVKLANDAASTEVPLSSDEIAVGVGLNVYTDEPIGSVNNQYAVKIIQI
jgi:hypothetical protein